MQQYKQKLLQINNNLYRIRVTHRKYQLCEWSYKHAKCLRIKFKNVFELALRIHNPKCNYAFDHKI